MTPTCEDLARARALVGNCLSPRSMVDLIGDTDILAQAGVNSLETIRLIAHCESLLGRVLTHREATGLDSITAVAALLSDHADGRGES